MELCKSVLRGAFSKDTMLLGQREHAVCAAVAFIEYSLVVGMAGARLNLSIGAQHHTETSIGGGRGCLKALGTVRT